MRESCIQFSSSFGFKVLHFQILQSDSKIHTLLKERKQKEPGRTEFVLLTRRYQDDEIKTCEMDVTSGTCRKDGKGFKTIIVRPEWRGYMISLVT
jgi:hypothetical protein